MRIRTAFAPLAVFGLLLIPAGCGNRQDGVSPATGTIIESVYASVTLQPDSMYRVHAAVSGILQANLVSEGDSVGPGSLLLRITNRSPELNVANARLQMELARSNYSGEATPLKDLQSQISTAELTFADDSVNYRRQEKLWAQKIGSQAAFENRKLAYERSRNLLTQLRSEYSRMENELRTRMVQAQNSYASSRATADEFEIRSTIGGKVYALYKEPGEVVLPNEPLAMIGKPDVFLAELLVDEVDVVQLQLGQTVLLTLDAYGEQVFEATVSKIYPQKDERNQTFRVEARFQDPPETLYPGMSGEANIVIDRREGVLTIPRNYLLPGDSVLTENGMKKIEVGIRTLDQVEVREGLGPGSRVLKPEE